jgi:hypothetical protein
MQRIRKMLAKTPARAVSIANVVVKSPEFAAAETALAELQSKQRTLCSEMNAAREKIDVRRPLHPLLGNVYEATVARITEIGVQLNALDREITSTQRMIAKHVPAHVAAVTAALRPLRLEVAQRASAAIVELLEAVTELGESNRAIEAAGGRALPLPEPPYLRGVLEMANAIALHEQSDSGAQ